MPAQLMHARSYLMQFIRPRDIDQALNEVEANTTYTCLMQFLQLIVSHITSFRYDSASQFLR